MLPSSRPAAAEPSPGWYFLRRLTYCKAWIDPTGVRPVFACSLVVMEKVVSNGGPPHTGKRTRKVRVAIIGVGNCASSLVQGVETGLGFRQLHSGLHCLAALLAKKLRRWHSMGLTHETSEDVGGSPPETSARGVRCL